MSRLKKGFGIQNQTLSAAEFTVKTIVTNSGKVDFLGGIAVTLLDIKDVEPDPTNPRTLAIKEIIQSGLRYESPSYIEEKTKIKDTSCLQELEKLESLALSIKANGLLNAVVVQKNGNKFKILTGERRFLACLLLGLDSISVKIISRHLNELDIKLIQWAENYDREDLTPYDRLNNVRQISNAYKHQNNSLPSVRKLAELMNIQKSQAARYLTLIKQDPDSELMIAIKENKITSLKTAEYISLITNFEEKNKLLALAVNGVPLKKLQEQNKKIFLNEKKDEYPLIIKIPANFAINKLLFNSIVQSTNFKKYLHSFSDIDWGNKEQIKTAWHSLFKFAETEAQE